MQPAEDLAQRRDRQAHDAVIVALDAADEQRAMPLDAVSARLVERLARGEVGRKLVLDRKSVV